MRLLNWLSKITLIPLKLVVYSNSKLLILTYLSLYGFIHGVAHVPRNRLNALKSLLHYALAVIQHGLY